jgi:hypothetical protein
MRHFFLRDRDTLFPVACIATERHDPNLAYALSVFHEGDEFNRNMARHAARERLTKYLQGGYDEPTAKSEHDWGKFGVVLIHDPKENAKIKLLEAIAFDTRLPSHVRVAAKEWAKHMMPLTPVQRAAQNKLDRECRIINGRLKMTEWWRARAIELQVELDLHHLPV